VLLISPFTPHLAEQLWEALGHSDGIVAAGWPECDEDAAREETIEIPVQVNGKVRGRVTVSAEAPESEIQAAALAAPQVQPYLEGKQVVKVIVARGRLVSVVVK
jgi:leucyl-tRNA synthetase